MAKMIPTDKIVYKSGDLPLMNNDDCFVHKRHCVLQRKNVCIISIISQFVKNLLEALFLPVMVSIYSNLLSPYINNKIGQSTLP